MTGFEFQKALAAFIRHPNTPPPEALLSVLSSDERSRLNRMMVDPLVRKFSSKMSCCRFRDAMSVARVTRCLANERLLEQLFLDEYEPLHHRTNFDQLGIAFLDTLLANARCRTDLNLDRGYLEDAIRYDRTKAAILRRTFHSDDRVLPPKSSLQHSAFSFLSLSWDVATIDKLLAQGAPVPERPHPKQHTLLFLKTTAAPFYRMFQIDDSIRRFIEGEAGEEAGRSPHPAAYNAMVTVGLCRPAI